MQFELAWSEHKLGAEEVIMAILRSELSLLVWFLNESVFAPFTIPQTISVWHLISFLKNIYHLFSVNIKTKHIALTVP